MPLVVDRTPEYDTGIAAERTFSAIATTEV